jgi:uncharacterized protein YuzE
MARVSSYDPEADVLYLNFRPRAKADDCEVTDDDIIVRYQRGRVVGATVLHARARFRGEGSGRTLRKLSVKKRIPMK